MDSVLYMDSFLCQLEKVACIPFLLLIKGISDHGYGRLSVQIQLTGQVSGE